MELPWQLHRSERSILVNGKHPQFKPQNSSLTSFACLFQALERCANQENAEEPTKGQLSFSTYVVITSAVCLIFFLTLIVIREYRRLKRQNNVVAINNSWDIKLLCKIVRVMKNTLLFIGRRETFTYEDGSTLTGLDWNTNMAAFSVIVSTSFPGFFLLLRERALVGGWQHGSQNMNQK